MWSINHQNVITQKVTNVFYKYSFSPHLVGENIFYSCFEHPASTILPSQSAVEEIYAAAWTDVLDIYRWGSYLLPDRDGFFLPTWLSLILRATFSSRHTCCDEAGLGLFNTMAAGWD